MRTMLAIDDDVLAAASALASAEKRSVDEVISALARRALLPVKLDLVHRNGIPLLPVQARASSVTPELVRQLREELL